MTSGKYVGGYSTSMVNWRVIPRLNPPPPKPFVIVLPKGLLGEPPLSMALGRATEFSLSDFWAPGFYFFISPSIFLISFEMFSISKLSSLS